MSTLIQPAADMRDASATGAEETVAELIAEAASRGEYSVSVENALAAQVATQLDANGYTTDVSWSSTTISWELTE